jgi:adenylosuccinate lyase
MIKRYSREILSNIWDDQNKYTIWLNIELLACQASVELGNVPAGSFDIIKSRATFNIDRINEIEKTVKHDVIAFLTSVSEFVGPDSRYLHMGMTSSDVLDTCFSLQLKQSAEVIKDEIAKLLNNLKEKALQYKNLICIGRSHGVHAEPITLGLKFARFYQEFKRNYARLENAIKEISICKISGAVGQFAGIVPFVEEFVAKKLGLTPETISSQVIPRDRHAMFFSTLAVIASSIENLAIEIRHMQRTEVLECAEFFSDGQKGSSAMPHKKNPVLTENLTGLARIVRSTVIPALENVALWHERDISHSSVERIIAPEACITIDFALHRLADVIKNLVVFEDNIKDNLNQLRGLVFSQKVLLKLINSGMTREDAYKIVQDNSMKTWKNKDSTFLENLKSDQRIKIDNLDSIFDYGDYTKNIDYIFDRIF